MEYRYDDNATNVKAMKYLIEHYFDNFKVDSIEIIGSGYDSVAYLVNNEYIFNAKNFRLSLKAPEIRAFRRI